MIFPALVALSRLSAGQTEPAQGSSEIVPPKIRQLISKLPAGSSHILHVPYVARNQTEARPHASQTLDVYAPPGEGPFPLIFWIHGGGWHSGDKLESGVHLALKFVPKGFALASVNYRLTGDSPFPAQIEDCNAALAYLRRNAASYRIDRYRIGTLGHSAGAHLAALMACTGNERRFSSGPQAPIRVQATVCWAIPADLDRDRGKWPATSMMYNPASAPLWGFFPDRRYDGEFARMASPASYVHEDVPPVHIVHGQKDDLVPPGQARAFAKSLKRAGVPVTLRVVSDRGHDVMNEESIDESIGFFTSTLKPLR